VSCRLRSAQVAASHQHLKAAFSPVRRVLGQADQANDVELYDGADDSLRRAHPISGIVQRGVQLQQFLGAAHPQ
jgi:hypothetical protein